MFQDKNSMEYCTFNYILNNAFKYSKGAGDIILGFCYHEYSYWTHWFWNSNLTTRSIKII
jgi:hypothetical protein